MDPKPDPLQPSLVIPLRGRLRSLHRPIPHRSIAPSLSPLNPTDIPIFIRHLVALAQKRTQPIAGTGN
ncbi:MAG: hypothetical protein AAF327_19060, partial [Cyanobacteria bacterium P01_A01_bin.37]